MIFGAKTLLIVTLLLLLIALFDMPYFYYQILRWIVCGVAGYSAYVEFEKEKSVWFYVFAFATLIYNPISPLFLNKEIWILIDLAFIILITAYLQKRHSKL